MITPELGQLQSGSRCLVMGILNVTPDSFSDGGRHFSPEKAIDRGEQLAAAGADLVDVGGESTRPGAVRIGEDEEARRVVPIVAELTRRGIPVSIDTMRSSIAARAVDVGAILVNDVSGGLADAAMAQVVVSRDVPWVLSHWRGHSRHMDSAANYDDVVSEVRTTLTQRIAAAVESGVSRDQIVLDPGLGFAKRTEHDLALVSDIAALVDIGLPVMIGASRKRFLGAALADDDSELRQVSDRDMATVATTTIAALAGVWAVRVHDVRSSSDAVRVVSAIAAAGRQRTHPAAYCPLQRGWSERGINA